MRVCIESHGSPPGCIREREAHSQFVGRASIVRDLCVTVICAATVNTVGRSTRQALWYSVLAVRTSTLSIRLLSNEFTNIYVFCCKVARRRPENNRASRGLDRKQLRAGSCSFDRVADEPRERPTDPLKSRPLLVVPRYRTTVGSTQHQGQQPARSAQHPAAEPSVHAHATRTQPSHAHFRDLVRPAHSGGGARRLLSLCAHYSVSTAGTTYQISIT